MQIHVCCILRSIFVVGVTVKLAEDFVVVAVTVFQWLSN
jgi:hypothetical protein